MAGPALICAYGPATGPQQLGSQHHGIRNFRALCRRSVPAVPSCRSYLGGNLMNARTCEKKSCADLIERELASRAEDIAALWRSYQEGEEEHEELGNLFEYGLCFDRVDAGTFERQRAPYWRWQFCYGGPADELRIYDNDDVVYAYMNWFDGATLDLDPSEHKAVIDAALCIRDLVGGSV